MADQSRPDAWVQIVLKGGAFERGLQHGRQLADHIRPRVDRLWQAARADRPEIRRSIEMTRELLASDLPDVYEEIRGIAEGAGLAAERVFLYNNRDLLGFKVADDCSHLCLFADGQVVVGMNKDMPTPLMDMYVLRKAYPSDGFASIGYAHVGRVWGYGMNARGLCTASTAVYPLHVDAKQPAVGLYHLPHLVLSTCESVGEAVERILSIENLSGGGNLLLADASGRSAVMELSPRQRVVREAEDGVLFSTNFFASGQIEHADRPEWLQESRERFDTLSSILTETTNTGVNAAAAALKAHRRNGSVCRHNVRGIDTVLSFLAFPQKGEFWLCKGFPCRSTYQKYEL